MTFSVLTAKISLTTDELRSLPEAVATFLVASCYAIDDITHHYRLLVSVITDKGQNDESESIFFVRKLAQLRTVSSKLVEYDALISKARDPSKFASNAPLKATLDAYKDDLRNIRRGVGRSVADHVRNHLSAHYSLDEAAKAISARNDQRSFTLLPNFKQGNTHYLIGDEIMFLDAFARVVREGHMRLEYADPIIVLSKWQDWTLDATRVTQKVHQAFMMKVFTDFFPEKRYEKVWLPLEKDRHTGVLGRTTIPIWWREDD
jgi:hypothetical protein